jgi:hypothetical protein
MNSTLFCFRVDPRIRTCVYYDFTKLTQNKGNQLIEMKNPLYSFGEVILTCYKYTSFYVR